MEPDDAQLDELMAMFAGEAANGLAGVLPGRDYRRLSKADEHEAEMFLRRFCDQADQRWSSLPRHAPLGPAGQKVLGQRLWDEIFGLGFLERYTDDREPDCEEISLDGPKKMVIWRAGNRVEIVNPRFPDDETYRAYIQRVIEMGGRRVDEASPYATVRLLA